MFLMDEKIPAFQWEVTEHCRCIEFLRRLEHLSARLVSVHGGETTLFFLTPLSVAEVRYQHIALGHHSHFLQQKIGNLFCESTGMDYVASGSSRQSSCPSHSEWM